MIIIVNGFFNKLDHEKNVQSCMSMCCFLLLYLNRPPPLKHWDHGIMIHVSWMGYDLMLASFEECIQVMN